MSEAALLLLAQQMLKWVNLATTLAQGGTELYSLFQQAHAGTITDDQLTALINQRNSELTSLLDAGAPIATN